MMYFIDEQKNSYGLVQFDHSTFDHKLFDEPSSLKGFINEPLIYSLTKKTNARKIISYNFLSSTGPELVSNALRSVIEVNAPFEVEFFDVNIICDNQCIEGFSCIHPLRTVEAMDMEKSEYEVCTFDPSNPDYTFNYLVLKGELEYEPNIARCQEFPQYLLVNDKIKNSCFAAKLKGLVFSRAIDMTYGDRSICEVIK